MNSASYAKAEKSIEDTGMYEIPVKYQQGEEQEKTAKKEFKFVLTGTTTVSYKNTWGETEIIRDGDTLKC